jgi:uncharacterized membrane protein YeiH
MSATIYATTAVLAAVFVLLYSHSRKQENEIERRIKRGDE